MCHKHTSNKIIPEDVRLHLVGSGDCDTFNQTSTRCISITQLALFCGLLWRDVALLKQRHSGSFSLLSFSNSLLSLVTYLGGFFKKIPVKAFLFRLPSRDL